jgi:hypothetical protein
MTRAAILGISIGPTLLVLCNIQIGDNNHQRNKRIYFLIPKQIVTNITYENYTYRLRDK